MQVTNGSVTLELQQADRRMVARNFQRLEDGSVSTRKPNLDQGTFYVVHNDNTLEIIGDVFPANGWSEVGSVAPAEPADEPVVEETPVEEEETADEEVAAEEPAVKEAPTPASKKSRKRFGHR